MAPLRSHYCLPISSLELFKDFYHDELKSTPITASTLRTKIGYSIEYPIELLPSSIADYYGIEASEVSLFYNSGSTVSGFPPHTTVHGLTLVGLNVLIYRTIWIDKAHTSEIYTFNYNLEMTEAGMDIHKGFTSKVKIDLAN